ncbi:hypothetical protein A7X67_14590 [Clostridium sp. W14A]|nr:hypothetical protein A7X67_14590 [Clostridium sp. W14A]
MKAIDEFNSEGHLIYAENYIGAFARGRTQREALNKFASEVQQYTRWLRKAVPSAEECQISVVQEKSTSLRIEDADSDVIFDSEKQLLTRSEYLELKQLALKSADDFLRLYNSIPDKFNTVLQPRKTFYGNVPITAKEMYEHTKNVNSYYFGEINIPVTNEPDILSCRREGFEKLEHRTDFLLNTVYDGSCDEQWSLRKVCRRFIWHDRIHAKAMYKMAVKLCGGQNIMNPFYFT